MILLFCSDFLFFSLLSCLCINEGFFLIAVVALLFDD